MQYINVLLVSVMLVTGKGIAAEQKSPLLTPLDIPIAKKADFSKEKEKRPEKWAEPLELDGVPNLHRVDKSFYRSAQPTEEGMQSLEAYGFKTVVSLRTFHSDRHLIGKKKLDYKRITMQPWEPEEGEIEEVLGILTDPERGPVLLHCQHGADRTGVVCAIYRIAVQGWPKEDATREMKNGGFGYHAVWDPAVDEFFEKLDMDKWKKRFAKSEKVETKNEIPEAK